MGNFGTRIAAAVLVASLLVLVLVLVPAVAGAAAAAKTYTFDVSGTEVAATLTWVPQFVGTRVWSLR
jgi:hypothetical protein